MKIKFTLVDYIIIILVICAVIFAYVTNRKYVFKIEQKSSKKEATKFLILLALLFTLLLDPVSGLVVVVHEVSNTNNNNKDNIEYSKTIDHVILMTEFIERILKTEDYEQFLYRQ